MNEYVLKNRPKRLNARPFDGDEMWFDGFELKFRKMDFDKWFKENQSAIMQRFNLHSTSGITPKEVLQFFVEKEILGEEYQ